MASWPFLVAAGLAVGLAMGLFGVGGSSVATPVLALLGVPALAAVASPLPAAIPAAALLIASGVVLVVAGARVLLPIKEETREAGTRRRRNRLLLVAVSAVIGVFTGLLANGGGFLLVPAYLLVFGLRMRQAVGTSLVVIAVLAMPTLAVHWALGHVNWVVAGEFGAGLLPGGLAGSRLAHRVQGPVLRKAFGWFLVTFGVFFTIYRAVRG